MLLRLARAATWVGAVFLFGGGFPATAATDSFSHVGAAGANVRSIAVDTKDQNRVYAAARNDGIWRSTDRGSTWTRSDSGLDFISAWGVSVDPVDPSIVWAATEVGGAYRSTDFGKTWRNTRSGRVDTTDDYSITNPSTNSLNLFANNWTDRDPDKANRGGAWGYPIDQCLSGQKQSDAPGPCAERADWPIGGYDQRDPDIDVSTPGAQPAPNPYPRHIFHFQFASDIAATQGGAWMTAFMASNNRMGGGAFKTSDNGATWSMMLRSPAGGRLPLASRGNIYKIEIAPSDPNRIYLASTTGMWRSRDGGKTWVGDDTQRVATAPGSSVDKAFELFPFFFGEGSAEVRSVAVDPKDPDVVYAGTWASGVHKSVDGGGAWTSSTNGLPEGAGVWDIAVNPVNPKNLFAALFFHGIYQSSDSGGTWTPFNSGLDADTARQVYTVTVDRGGSPQNLYAGTINGVYRLSSETLGRALAATGPPGGVTPIAGLAMILAGLFLSKKMRVRHSR